MVLLLTAALIAPGFAAKIRQIGWKDLKVNFEFDDPFAALTRDQLYDLGTYARVFAMRDQNPDGVTESMRKEAEEAERNLRKEGIDIEGLLARREEIKTLRARRAHAVDPALDGVSIRMPGYALPLDYDGKKITEFLLVPWVGACIHTPPPPPNQIVHVALDEGIVVGSRFQPVWVTGTLTVGASSKELYLVDGSSKINIGYSINGAVVKEYNHN
jgi:hypothetical protein